MTWHGLIPPYDVEPDDEPAEEEEQKPRYCEDFPCCGHEAGDCDGSKYGSDESIKQRVYDRMNDDSIDDDHDFEPEGWY